MCVKLTLPLSQLHQKHSSLEHEVLPLNLLLPLRNDIQFSNFSPFLTRLSKGIKRKRKRIRNHRLTRKRKTRCYGHKDNKKYAKHVKNNACKRISIDREMARQVSSIIDVDRCSCRGFVEGQINKRLKRSRSIHQVSRSYRGDRNLLDRFTRYRGAGEIAIRKILGSSTDSQLSRRCRASFSKHFFERRKTQPRMQSSMQLNQ